jgi:hypothetical protein
MVKTQKRYEMEGLIVAAMMFILSFALFIELS